jgi:hypothetical protein
MVLPLCVLFQSALKKLHSFVTGRILETKVAGHFMATVIRSFAKVSSAQTFRSLACVLCGFSTLGDSAEEFLLFDSVLSVVENIVLRRKLCNVNSEKRWVGHDIVWKPRTACMCKRMLKKSS